MGVLIAKEVPNLGTDYKRQLKGRGNHRRMVCSGSMFAQDPKPFLCVVLSLALWPFAALSESQWELLAEEEGIKVERRERPESPMPIFRGTGYVNVAWHSVLAFLNNVENNDTWMYGCTESRILERGELGTFTVYHRTGAPWPLWDRDVVIRTKLLRHPDGTFEVTLQSIDDSRMPELDGIVRMPRLVGSYLLKPEQHRTQIAFEIDVEPGGSVPIWLVKMVSLNLPLQTLRNLRAEVVRLEKLGTYRESSRRFQRHFFPSVLPP